jgi:hypothetical protein
LFVFDAKLFVFGAKTNNFAPLLSHNVGKNNPLRIQ